MSMNTLQNISRLSHIEIISMFKIMQNLHSFKVLVTQSHPTLCDHVDYSLPGSSVHRTLQARILEWVAISFSRGSSWLRDLVQVSFIADRFFTVWVTFRFSSVQSLSRLWLQPHESQHSRPPVHHQLPEFTQTHVHWVGDVWLPTVMPSSHLILCRPLFLLSPIPPIIRVFSNESTLPMRWPKYWCFSFSIIPSKEHPGLISFRMDWLDLLAVQRTLRSLLQHHSSKASIIGCSAFFTVQLSHPYIQPSKFKVRMNLLWPTW